MSPERLLTIASMCVPVVPTLVLPTLLGDDSDEHLRHHIAAFGVYLTLSARARRCQRAMPDPMRVRELDNERAAAASPSRHPAWLLFELEQDLSIRAVQVQLALEMLSKGDEVNRCLQLNMGECKTSVIITKLALPSPPRAWWPRRRS